MRVLAFGTYDRGYPRNAQVVSALRGAGVDVVEANRAVWEARDNWSLGATQVARVARAEVSLARERTDADALLVGYPGHFDLFTARRVADGRPVIFNPLISLHDTLVDDRGRFRAGGLAAAAIGAIDRRAFRAADLVVADTQAHAAFFAGRFGLGPERLAVCPVGADDRLFTPGPAPPGPFQALFVGKLIPLHGVDIVLETARRLPDIAFRIVGSGQLGHLLRARPANVDWVPWLEPSELPCAYRAAGCALGVFGTSSKAQRVVPNKAFQAIACGRPLVTADTAAARELLTDGVDALLVPAGDPGALAAAVARLAGDRALRERLGGAARATYEARASEAILGPQWRRLIEKAICRTMTHAGR